MVFFKRLMTVSLVVLWLIIIGQFFDFVFNLGLTNLLFLIFSVVFAFILGLGFYRYSVED